MKTSLLLIGLCAALAPFTPFAHGGSKQAQYRFRRIAGGFDAPVYVAQPRSEPRRLYVVEQAGRIITLANGKRTTFLDIRSRVESGGEQGLLSVAFHPRYARNHRFYVYYTVRGSGDIEIDSFRSRRGRGVLASRRRLLRVAHHVNSNHNGGQLEFGPDGFLYAGTGDGGSEGDPRNNAQNLSRKLGKLLRYARGRWRLAAYGLRNPWRFSFDRANGDLYIGDVGQDEWEEIDYLARARLGQLINYGWSAYEGNARYKPSRLSRRGPLVAPVHVYSHDDGCSVTGGYVYRGGAVPAARGRYFYGDYCSGTVWSLRVSRGKAVDNRRESSHIGGLSSFGEGTRGELYAVSLGGGIYRLTS